MNPSNDWGRDSDLSMSNGPYGDEDVAFKREYCTPDKLLSQEYIKTLIAEWENNFPACKRFVGKFEDNCTCGTDKVYGKTASPRMHSDWCPKHGKVDG